ncbi:MAG: branched-chain amino acid transport system substrate-binding protein [Cryptosporangiaceae bacterium]|nr:branched-chain amino acid transport system substrate-binding protein [Cryptosporangiaceae bacterium]
MRSGLRALTAVCALSLVAAAGCGRPGDALAEQVTIGATLELTGPAAIVGLAHRNALQLAADQLNAAGGVRGQRINLRIRDNRSLPDVAAADVKALAAGDVAAIIGGGTTETSVAAAIEAEQARVPLIALGPSPEITAPAEQRRYTFKTEPNPDAVVGTLVDEFGVQNIRSIGIFASTGTYGDAGLAALQAGAAQRNIRVAGIERFGEDDRDLDAAAGRLRAIRPDAVVVWSPLPGAGVAARSLRDSG